MVEKKYSFYVSEDEDLGNDLPEEETEETPEEDENFEDETEEDAE